MKRLALTPEQIKDLEPKLNLQADEDYCVTLQRRPGVVTYGVHVFERQPTEKELVAYEEATSRLRYRGNRAEFEGSSIRAAGTLYNVLIARAYDILVGRRTHDELDKAGAKSTVPPLLKRAAIQEFLGNVAGMTSQADLEGDPDTDGRAADSD